ncbi:MAG: hypothetical protein HQL45_09620 [Alphaproteobacteria bacterium]|nr:hypothetical protein [Alphaproteobacteria bacterium]
MGRLRICILGDDLATTLGDAGGVGWTGHLTRSETSFGGRFELMALGVAGEVTRDLASRAEAETAARLHDHAASLVLFCFGVADMSANEAEGVRLSLPESMFWAETVMRNSLRNYPTLWVGPPPLRPKSVWRDSEGRVWHLNGSRLMGLNDAYKSLAEQLGVPYLDLMGTLNRDRRWQRAIEQGNGVHPLSEGHAALSNYIGRWSAWRKHLNPAAPGFLSEGLHAPTPKTALIA